jgi:cyclic pyranopterin monophosphate synthase
MDEAKLQQPFSHLDREGKARMVDVSAKEITRREARASCRVLISAETRDRLDKMPKGDALTVARLAGIAAAKRVDELVPLAHTLPLDQVAIEILPVEDGVRIESLVVATARTGAEIEALAACSGAALALYDMIKAVEKGAVITDLRLEAKSGGRSGTYVRGSEGTAAGPLPPAPLSVDGEGGESIRRGVPPPAPPETAKGQR